MVESCKTVSEHFVCSVDTVWEILTDPSSYKDWFGWPQTLELLEVEPGFDLGGKLTFRNSASTLVISDIIEKQKLVLTGGYRTDEINIRAAENGCRVSLVSYTNGVGFQNTEAAQETCNRNILKNLRRSCYIREGKLSRELEQQEDGRIGEQLFKMALGYKKARVNSTADSPFTEATLAIPARSGLVGLLLSVILTLAICLSLTFPRSDIVASSGLSIVESDKVCLENAVNIEIGQTKNDLEVMLSCVGRQLALDEYSYSSTKKLADGSPAYEIRVLYDAYGKVRRFGFIDYAACEGGDIPVMSVARQLSPSMNAADVCETLGIDLSAFWSDKSGKSYMYFGRYLPSEGLFNANQTAQLVVSLDSVNIITRVGYYLSPNSENPLHIDALSKNTKRQYSSLSQYRSDLAFFERSFLLPGRSREEVEILLSMAQRIAETKLRYGGSEVEYLCTEQPDGSFRHRFTVTFSEEGVAESVKYENLKLSSKSDCLAEEYELSAGMTDYEVYGEMMILPSLVMITDDGQMNLGYGSRAKSGAVFSRSWQLALVFGEDGRLTTVTDNRH